MTRLTPTGLLTTLSFVTLLAGAIILARGVCLTWDGESSDLLGPGATVVAAATAGVISAQSIKTWKQQRQLDRDKANFQMKQQVYGAIAQDLVNTFPSGSASGELRRIRANAAVWASTETIQELSQWQAAKQRAIAGGRRLNGNTYELSSTSQDEMKTHLGRVIIAMRSDLFDEDALSRDEIIKSIFDDSHKNRSEREDQ